MSEHKAFIAGFTEAVKVIRQLRAEQGEWPTGDAEKLADAAVTALIYLAEAVPDLDAAFEGWKLSQDPEFMESLAQMRRGEGVRLDDEK